MRTSIRLANETDFDKLVDLTTEAFLRDPVYNYFGSLKELIPNDHDTKEKNNLRKWARLLLDLCVLAGGRVTVLVEHEEVMSDGDESVETERIVGVAEWFPPNKRITLWDVRKMVKAGIVGMIRAWGLGVLIKRCSFEWLDKAEKPMIEWFQQRNLGDPDETWYLSVIAVTPECQGNGYMGKLIREAIDNAPNALFTLIATTAGSRDKYVHLGFEVVGVASLGRGKYNSQGLKVKGSAAVGLEAYPMVKLAQEDG